MKNTIQDSVLTALKNGQELTSSQIASKFKAGNPQAVIQSLRFAGYPCIQHKENGTMKYRLASSKSSCSFCYRARRKI